jgi:hypothetical protein
MAMLSSGAAGADSATVSYQGVLRNANGTSAPDGNYDAVFSIWDASTGGNQLWAETHAAVPVKDGALSVQLGEATPFGTLFADHGALWLEISVNTGTGPEIYDPRVALSSVPYAKKAENAATATNAATAGNTDTLDSLHASAFSAPVHNHDGADITTGTISTDRFSAYPDLTAEGKIGPGASQVAVGNHRHDSLPYFIGQVGGEVAVNVAKSLSTAATSGIVNNGTSLTVQVAGRYFVHFQQLINTTNAFYLQLRHNGNCVALGYFTGNTMADMIVSREVDMAAGDHITFVTTGSSAVTAWGGEHSSVSMYMTD